LGEPEIGQPVANKSALGKESPTKKSAEILKCAIEDRYDLSSNFGRTIV
jgi:hypothetical protein